MLARDPRDRYQTASELIVDLERSNLAAAVPSFIDQADALNDPLVRERLTTPAQATVLDVARGGPPLVFWYVLYRDKKGSMAKAKMSTALLKKRLQAGKVNAGARAARSPKGPFSPLHALAEFDDVAPPPVLCAPRKFPAKTAAAAQLGVKPAADWWLWSVTLVVSVLVLLMLVVLVWPQ